MCRSRAQGWQNIDLEALMTFIECVALALLFSYVNTDNDNRMNIPT